MASLNSKISNYFFKNIYSSPARTFILKIHFHYKVTKSDHFLSQKN